MLVIQLNYLAINNSIYIDIYRFYKLTILFIIYFREWHYEKM